MAWPWVIKRYNYTITERMHVSRSMNNSGHICAVWRVFSRYPETCCTWTGWFCHRPHCNGFSDPTQVGKVSHNHWEIFSHVTSMLSGQKKWTSLYNHNWYRKGQTTPLSRHLYPNPLPHPNIVWADRSPLVSVWVVTSISPHPFFLLIFIHILIWQNVTLSTSEFWQVRDI